MERQFWTLYVAEDILMFDIKFNITDSSYA